MINLSREATIEDNVKDNFIADKIKAHIKDVSAEKYKTEQITFSVLTDFSPIPIEEFVYSKTDI